MIGCCETASVFLRMLVLSGSISTKPLDLTHSEALEYVRQVIHTATHDWGYQFLKLDFLFAAALGGRFRDRTKDASASTSNGA